jgi:CelD/BcsL family acetyltransferase involved in cellulose biosynthesis
MQFGFVRAGGYYVVKTTYDESYGKCSPGQLLVKLMIERSAKEGIQRYDFLGVRSLWKCVWTSAVLKHSNCYIFRPTIKGRILYTMTMHGWRLVRLAHVKINGDLQDIGVDRSPQGFKSGKSSEAK